jgi:hypothetical protein
VLLLEAAGRRTGKLRETPMIYLMDHDVPVVMPANAGHRRPPAWWLNLKDAGEDLLQEALERLLRKWHKVERQHRPTTTAPARPAAPGTSGSAHRNTSCALPRFMLVRGGGVRQDGSRVPARPLR